ncbi:hypothetical protein C8R44DRAFT_869085 [Mycena epipterygia]|nr:hypothetical protein C8R44DRAFT_869085 [Mycena epipterygia]
MQAETALSYTGVCVRQSVVTRVPYKHLPQFALQVGIHGLPEFRWSTSSTPSEYVSNVTLVILAALRSPVVVVVAAQCTTPPLGVQKRLGSMRPGVILQPSTNPARRTPTFPPPAVAPASLDAIAFVVAAEHVTVEVGGEWESRVDGGRREPGYAPLQPLCARFRRSDTASPPGRRNYDAETADGL